MVNHNYVLADDIIEIGGVDAIKKVCEKGNTVSINFDKLARDAKNEKNRSHRQLQDILNFIEKFSVIDFQNKRFKLVTGGFLSWDKPSEDSVILTKDTSLKSRLLREGKKFEEPYFIEYGQELLNKGFETVDYNLDLNSITLDSLVEETGIDIINNMFVRINGCGMIYQINFPLIPNKDNSRFELDESNGSLVKINTDRINSNFKNFQLRSLEQKLGYSLLTDKNLEAVFVSGGSGSGKTIISYVAGVESILGNEKLRNAKSIHEGIVLFKSNDIIGGKSREQGFLPGSAYQKVKPFMKSYEDAHKLAGIPISFSEMLAHPTDEKNEFGIRNNDKIGNDYLPKRNPAIEIEHLQYARGRTFENMLIIVDEAQNYTPFEMKQLIERIGVGSKLLLVGDPEQIDNPCLDSKFNGLVYAASVFSGTHPRYGSIVLPKNYRSQSAEIMRGHNAPLTKLD